MPSPEPSPNQARQRRHRDILGTGHKRYSQHDEDLIIRDFFQNRRGGVFLDVGCAWPVKHSNTYFLEKRLGWSGIGVDALAEFAEPWRRERPNARFFNYLVTDHAGTAEKFYRADGLPGISSVEPRKSFSGLEVKHEELVVPTITLTQLLDANGVARIDLLSLDIEGHELEALAGFDIRRFRPELACVEWYHAGREKILAYFTAQGYERIERYTGPDRVNDYYTPSTSLVAAK